MLWLMELTAKFTFGLEVLISKYFDNLIDLEFMFSFLFESDDELYFDAFVQRQSLLDGP